MEENSNCKFTARRDGHATTALKGFIFMFGGWDETQYFNDLQVFDSTKLVATGAGGTQLITWFELKTIPSTPLPESATVIRWYP